MLKNCQYYYKKLIIQTNDLNSHLVIGKPLEDPGSLKSLHSKKKLLSFAVPF